MSPTDNYLSRSASASSERRWLWRTGIEREGLEALELANCAGDVGHWLSHWCYTADPRDLAVYPFDPFPRQAEFLRWLQEREALQEDGLVEKSRDMGVTWLCCAYALHGWLFRPSFSCGFGSRKLELVDRLGDLDSIIEKVRFMLYGLPGWMRPPGFRRKDHDNLARLVNPDTGASVTGEGGDNIGRGGRKTVFFVDEAAFIERPEMVDRALSENTRVRIDVSTPCGLGNPFARKRFSGQVPVFVFDWRHDPRKGEAWYAEQRRKKDPVTLAQEVDRDYSASVEGVTVPAAWVRAAVGLPLPASGRAVAGLDVADGGKARCVFTPRRGPAVGTQAAWPGVNTTETAWRARDEAVRAGAAVLAYDAVGVGAGVRGALESAGRLPFALLAVNGGAQASDRVWPDGRTSREMFHNLRAELWWLVRCRFERAYEFREKGVAHPPASMISLPDDPQLIAELSLPLHSHTSAGRVQIESKEAMRRRGVASPDAADSLVYSEAALLLPPPPPRPQVAGTRPATRPPGQVWPPPGLPRPY